MRLEFTGLNRWCRQIALKEITFENCFIDGLCRAGMLWGDAEDKVICRFKNVTFKFKEGTENFPILAVGNVEKLLFEDCTFVGDVKPVVFVGTDDLENIEVVRSGDIELKKVSFAECLEVHPSGIAQDDQGKLHFWDLKDPNAPPVPASEELRKVLLNKLRS